MTGERRTIGGVNVSVVTLEQAADRVVRAAQRREPLGVTALAVHGLVLGMQDKEFAGCLNSLGLVVPDGQPVRWALNLLHRSGQKSAVRGTDLTRAVLARAEAEELPIFLYGSTSNTISRLEEMIRASYPVLEIAGRAASRFEAVGKDEFAQLAERIATSGARICFAGLGCPRQERFAALLSVEAGMPVVAVGAAYDYLAGTLTEPPRLIQQLGFEWLWRLMLEPRRLWKRYLVLNPIFLAAVLAQVLRIRKVDAIPPRMPPRGRVDV